MKICVTGGAGFIGSHLVRKLVENNDKVLLIDNFFSGREENILKVANEVEILNADIRNINTIEKKIFKFKPDICYHLAAIHFIPYCNENPTEVIEVNIKGTLNIIESLKKTNIKKFIFFSSAAIYGINENANAEDDSPDPIDIYGISKLTGEKLSILFNHNTGVQTFIIRLFNVYGPNETNPHLIPEIIMQAKKGDIVQIGNLEPKRDYIYVSDVINALINILHTEIKGYQILNIGTGKSYSVNEILNFIEIILGKRFKIIQNKDKIRKIDRINLLADISKACQLLNWQPQIDIIKGLKKTIEFYL